MRGALIAVEGLDKAGKSTQCQRLANTLTSQGHTVMQLRFPDRSTPIGQMIDAYLRNGAEMEDHAIHLLFSANRWEAVKNIRAAINAGTIVIVDRYYYSGIVYSVAKDNPELDFQWARQPDEGLPRPDICIFLDISSDAASTRGGGFGDEKYETKQMQFRVRENFRILLEHEKESVVTIDAGKSMEVVELEVLDAALAVIRHVHASQLPLGIVEPWKP